MRGFVRLMAVVVTAAVFVVACSKDKDSGKITLDSPAVFFAQAGGSATVGFTAQNIKTLSATSKPTGWDEAVVDLAGATISVKAPSAEDIESGDAVKTGSFSFTGYTPGGTLVSATLFAGIVTTKDISAEGGTAVVMDGGTGEIYAAATLPYLNPADMSTVEEGADQLKAVTQAYEPGSVFKTVSTMALLETDSMKPDDTLFCPAVIEADGYKVSDSHERDDATFTLREILDQSSNVGISLSVEKMGFDKLYDHIKTYNLNEPTGVDYPGEASGTLQPFDKWARITGYNVSFGQGIAVTPLQITRFYGALVNDGVEVTPHFLINLPQTGETPTYATEDVIANKSAIPTMVDMLKTVVTDGTGKPAQIEGFSVAGKTSTAEVAEGGKYKEDVYNLCFTGFLADSSSQLVCFVGANEVPGTGNVAGVFKDIMTCAIDRFKIMPE